MTTKVTILTEDESYTIEGDNSPDEELLDNNPLKIGLSPDNFPEELAGSTVTDLEMVVTVDGRTESGAVVDVGAHGSDTVFHVDTDQ